jgi:Putative Flp pilus-assembly TadE/G-like
MNLRLRSFFSRALKDERGQTLPFMFFLIALLMGAAGLSVDLGHAYVCYRELQSSTDAAALAGAGVMAASTATQSSVKAVVSEFSSAPGGYNTNSNLTETSSSISTSFKCLTTVTNDGIPCTASPLDANTIQVQQTATVPTFFIRVLSLFGVKAAQSLSLGAVSTAAMRGSAAQYNVAIVLDATESMNNSDSDANCGSTRIKCALEGVQTLMNELTPCTASSTSTNCTPYDQVSLFVFPNVVADTAKYDTTCPSGGGSSGGGGGGRHGGGGGGGGSTTSPTNTTYSTPGGAQSSGLPAAWTATDFTSTNPSYQITDYLSDYSSTNKEGGSFNTSSGLVVAAGGGGCQGIQAIGGDGTYYAAAVYAALSSLAAAQTANPGSSNALIVLSDGDASSTKISATSPYTKLTTNGTYPSAIDQCHQAITAAQTANSMTDTTVYTVAYGASNSSTGSCSTDSPHISACSALQQMATSSADFYSDATAAQNAGQCVSSANGSLSGLNSIFQSIGDQLSVARLIPNGTT